MALTLAPGGALTVSCWLPPFPAGVRPTIRATKNGGTMKKQTVEIGFRMTAREVAEQMKADKAVSDCLQPPVKPTPGPWLLDTTERCYTGKIVRHNGVQICRMIDQVTTDTLEVEANARLIAAAPETAAERDRLKATNADLLAAVRRALASTSKVS